MSITFASLQLSEISLVHQDHIEMVEMGLEITSTSSLNTLGVPTSLRDLWQSRQSTRSLTVFTWIMVCLFWSPLQTSKSGSWVPWAGLTFESWCKKHIENLSLFLTLSGLCSPLKLSSVTWNRRYTTAYKRHLKRMVLLLSLLCTSGGRLMFDMYSNVHEVSAFSK